MKIRSLHKNLDTVYVNLSALLRYLREKNFAGLVRVDIRDYKAEIVFDDKQRVRMREFDHKAGTMAEQGGGLQRLLNRASQPGGIINVYESIEPKKAEWREINSGDILDIVTPVKGKIMPSADNGAPKIPKPIEHMFPAANGNGNGNGKSNGNGHAPNGVQAEVSAAPAEAKPTAKYLAANEWAELTTLTAELLGTIDRTLQAANLGFTEAFNKARLEISTEFPLLNPNKGIFLYADEMVVLQQEVDPAMLVTGVSECLRRIMNKLVSNPKFFILYKQIAQQLHIMVRQNQTQFDKYGYTKKLEGIMKF